jgi:Arc/MetJ-type ribon-helix-helix transcriptional regulator
MAMRKVTVAMTEEMYSDLEEERKARRLSSVAEASRVVIGEYLRSRQEVKQ